MPATQLSTDAWHPELVEPDPINEPIDSADELAGLNFEDLPRQRVAPPPLPAALLDVTTLRTQYQQALHDYNSLRAQVLIADGPAMRHATPRITDLRQRADADRPYLLAVHDVTAQWADAETEYEHAINSVEWARTQLHELQAQPDADPLDIASAKLDIQLRLMQMPDTAPAQHYHAPLQEALAAQAHAAGGAENIISAADVDNVIAAVSAEDDQEVLAARQHCTQLRRDLGRAELAAAAAFAAAETRSAEHITAQLDQLATELRVLEAASSYQPHRQLTLAPSAVADLPPATASALTSTAGLPFAVTVVYAQSSPERRAALHTLHSAAAAADRKILWCSPTREQADAVLDDELTHTAATITEAHANITSQHSQLPAGSLLIVDDAASADPNVLADLAEHAAANQSGLILLDTTSQQWPPQPSQRLLRLLGTELPWTTTLTPRTSQDVINHAAPPDLDPALTQTRRLHPTLLDDHLRASLTRADQLHTTIHAAYQRHLNATWLRHRHHDRSPEQQTPETGLDLTDG
ncbi:MAG TPA: AAA family ATPase [Mycobacterium sp.]|nr:AAA family ATPase [Mycobacterium sp.]